MPPRPRSSRRRLLRALAPLFCLSALLSLSAAALPGCGGQIAHEKLVGQPRDWARSPAVIELDAGAEVLALGDAHGDAARLTALLEGAGVIDHGAPSPGEVRWKAGQATLVCTGDFIDKWGEGLSVIALLRALEEQAPAQGGRVIVLLGNHEAEFLGDPGGKKAQDFVDELKAQGLSPDDVASGKHPIGAWMRALPVAARVGDLVFSHAGHTHGKTLAQIGDEVRAGVDAEGFATAALSADDSLLEAKLDPPWWEGNGGESLLAAYAHAASGERLVMGHQPGSVTFAEGDKRPSGEPYQKFGRVFLIDTGMSRGVDKSQGALVRFRAGSDGKTASAEALFPDGSSKTIYP